MRKVKTAEASDWMINKLKLKSGRVPDGAAEEFLTSPVTVFVGPNNSGKSKILQEIDRYCRSGLSSTSDLLLDDIGFESFSSETANNRILLHAIKPEPNETVQPDHSLFGFGTRRVQLPSSQFRRALINPNEMPNEFCTWFLQHNTLMLNGQSRLSLANPQPAGNLQRPANTSLQVLFHDEEKRAEVRRIIHEAFGDYFVLDPTNVGHLHPRLSRRPPKSEIEEKGFHGEAVAFHKDANLLEWASDGVKAFSGIIVEIVAGDPLVLLIDEPEAFLHPSLSFKLGKEICVAGAESEKRIFVATHSANFVMGCIQSGVPVNIVRLTYQGHLGTARVLKSDDIVELMRDPLLRSARVITGLFYECVVVTESDSDRAFYQEINERLLASTSGRGINNCLFLNAQNKQTVARIIKPLRNLGIPAAGIVDVDVLKEGGSVWTNLLDSIGIPSVERTSLAGVRSEIKQRFDSLKGDMKRDGGVTLLDVSDREAANNLFDQLERYGLFVVRNGEIECWLSELNASGHGAKWLVNIFELMGEDPTSADYVGPQEEDVWSFISQVGRWASDPNKRGIPA